MTNTQMPPGKYFISHSYKDADVRDKMIAQLPDGVEHYIFPPINASPLEFVSNSLIGAILACDSMIYLNEGASENSFWVAFERDYALRVKSNKQVYSYTPSNNALSLHSGDPLDLSVFINYTRVDVATVEPIVEFMKNRRYFDTEFFKDIPPDKWKSVVYDAIDNVVVRGGYMIFFFSQNSIESKWVLKELGNVANERVVVAVIDDSTEEQVKEYMGEIDAPTVFLMENGQINNNRIDDLIVRLYWLIFGNQYPEPETSRRKIYTNPELEAKLSQIEKSFLKKIRTPKSDGLGQLTYQTDRAMLQAYIPVLMSWRTDHGRTNEMYVRILEGLVNQGLIKVDISTKPYIYEPIFEDELPDNFEPPCAFMKISGSGYAWKAYRVYESYDEAYAKQKHR